MIKVYDNIRVLSQMREKEIPLGFVIPWEDTAAKRKQLETAQNWAKSDPVYNKETKQYDYTEGKDWGILPNDPQTGFKLSESIRRYGWSGSGNVVWRMEDPRGFEFEIPSENMAQILLSCGIGENGVIERPCIYGREGARNVLLPEGTEFYKTSINSKVLEKQKKDAKLSAKDVPVGSLVSGPSIKEHFYMGQVKVVSNDPKQNGKKFYLFAEYNAPWTDYYFHQRSEEEKKARKDCWHFHLYSGFSITEIHEEGSGTNSPKHLEELEHAYGVRKVPVPKNFDDLPERTGTNLLTYDYKNYWARYEEKQKDYCEYYTQYNTYEEKLAAVTGLWANPLKQSLSRHCRENYLQIGVKSSIGKITKLEFL